MKTAPYLLSAFLVLPPFQQEMRVDAPAQEHIEQRSCDGHAAGAPRPITACTIDSAGNLWAGSRKKGLLRVSPEGHRKQFSWHELPYDEFTAAASSPDGDVWFGTTRGAIRYDGERFRYRAGQRWLPHDEVEGIHVGMDGTVQISTRGGISYIRKVPMTLEQKAQYFEEMIAQRHEHDGFVLEASVAATGWKPKKTDNDGLLTGLFVAAQSFRYAATGDPAAREAATRSMRALRLLEEATGIPGFPARTLTPISDPDPNPIYGGTLAQQLERRKRDPFWKILIPRFPVTPDGKWYWSGDTSSDELDGHFFAAGIYYDLVASTPDEQRLAQEHVSRIAGHLIRNGYNLIDRDGMPTRFGWFSPDRLLNNPFRARSWKEFRQRAEWRLSRNLLAMKLLSYLTVAEHVTGEQRFTDALSELKQQFGYGAHAQRIQHRAVPIVDYSAVQLQFMNYYNLVHYERDPALRQSWIGRLHHACRIHADERNPLYNILAAGALLQHTGNLPTDIEEGVRQGIKTLQRLPLDRVDHDVHNSHRNDVRRMLIGSVPRYEHFSGGPLPIDETRILRWAHDPYQVDGGRSGKIEESPTQYLLPYYMGLYYRLWSEE